eukprot:TRINITY_DN7261_c0_g1_i1.p1 TRINITY_DN7261_c0_g1~~TRINITY_DN7261_c0_g1_i1.p1  ORF type:complete len:595 (+),score=91.37 TRINITY_DN7261_c0_g1_i1:87-1871(+)
MAPRLAFALFYLPYAAQSYESEVSAEARLEQHHHHGHAAAVMRREHLHVSHHHQSSSHHQQSSSRHHHQSSSRHHQTSSRLHQSSHSQHQSHGKALHRLRSHLESSDLSAEDMHRASKAASGPEVPFSDTQEATQQVLLSDTQEATQQVPFSNTQEATQQDVYQMDLTAKDVTAKRYPVINAWACALMCAGHAAYGCCSYFGNTKPAKDEWGFEDETGFCEFTPGNKGVTTISSPEENVEGWKSAHCFPGFGTAKCSQWAEGRCVRTPESVNGSVGLSKWELVWEDHFDEYSCKPDEYGVLRPNPEFWSYEHGYKRGKELQWFQPDNARCKDGALVITAKRERNSWEGDYDEEGKKCVVKNYDPGQNGQQLVDANCDVCGTPDLHYQNPCDLLQNTAGGSGKACDCSSSAQYTSASITTRDKKAFGYGLYEIRAKVDTRSGAWSSWWALGDFEDVLWPKNGEIDILDAFQRMVKGSVIHSDDTGKPKAAVQHAGARVIDRQWERYYHTWQMEWDEKFIAIRIDGEEITRLDLSAADPTRTSFPNPFTTNEKKFFLILTLAVGGHSGGDASLSEFPTDFQVDYIRFWEKRGRTER